MSTKKSFLGIIGAALLALIIFSSFFVPVVQVFELGL